MNRIVLVTVFVFSGCYYGPGVTRVETNAIRRSARDLDPYPALMERSNTLGQDFGASVLDSTLSPLILGPDEIDPQGMQKRDYEENMRRQEEAMKAMDRELDELDRAKRSR